MKFDTQQNNIAQVLVEVDDFIVSTNASVRDQIKAFNKRFHFGKWVEGSAEYAGRRIDVMEDKIVVSQHKYIVEQILPVALAKGRRSEKHAALSDHEFEAFRSLVYKINWVAKETRPEVSGLASIMASRMKSAEDLVIVNKAVNFLRNTSFGGGSSYGS